MPASQPRLWFTTVTTLAAFGAGSLVTGSAPAPSAGHEARPTAVAPVADHVGRGHPYIETRLFFGTGRHHGEPPISEEEFLDFVAEHVTPRFPDGLTIQRGYGQWRDRRGAINRERSYELIVLYPVAEARQRDADIEHIRDAYTARYDQESVMRVDAPTSTDF